MTTESLDRRIVAALEREGRTGQLQERLSGDEQPGPETELLTRVADTVGAPAAEVTDRLRDLQERGVIQGYRPRIDYHALGHSHVAVIRLAVTGGESEAVCNRLRDKSEIVDVYKVTAPHDVVAVGRFPDPDAMNRLVRRLHVDEDITSVKADVVIDIVRDHDVPFALDEG